MRENLPVTENEYVLEKDEMIVSKTDLRGKITYVNDDFIRISGFTEEELVGSPQNIIRHPDMPEDAFRDFWDSLKAGRSWTGLVKNRCKNGDHYWVVANASPIRENGEITGYMSVRTKPTREQVQEASKYYKMIREGSDPKLGVRDGAIHRKTIKDRVRFITDLSVRGRLFGLIAIMAIGMIVLGAVGLSELSDLRNQNRVLYNGELLPLSELANIQDELNEVRLLSLQAQFADRPAEVAPLQQGLNESAEALRGMWGEFEGGVARLPEGARELTTGFSADLDQFLTDSAEVLRLARQGDFQASERFAANNLREEFDQLETRVEELSEGLGASAKKVFAHSEETFTRSGWEIALICLIVVIIAIVLGLMLSRSITAPLKSVIWYFNRISEGKLDDNITVGRYDEIGRVMDALRTTQTQLNFSVNDTQRTLNANLRIRRALDGVGTGVIITNADQKVIYANDAITTMLGKAQQFLQEKLPSFDRSNLEAFQLDDFLRDENWEPCIKGKLEGRQAFDITLGSRHLRVSASPVINEQGKTLGVATEWEDRTAEINAEKEVAAVVAGAAEGDFSVKIDSADKEGFFRQLADGLNSLTDVTDQGLDDIGRVLGAISRRDMTERVTAEYRGKFDELKTYCNETSQNLSQMIGEIRAASDTIATAANEIAQGNTDLSSRTEEQASNLEETASSMEELTSTVKQNTDNARQANTLSDQATQVAQDGGELVSQVVSTMNDINESAQKIEEIIGVIDSIAFQTNILALNAAVEAARAGDQGRGFAVVASEVRTLAQRSANAAKDIKGLISDSVSKIQSGNQLVNQSGEKTQEIVTAIKRVSDINEEISAASEEQSSGIENINTAVSQMDEMTQQNAALVEEAAAAAESQQSQVESLQHMLTRFTLKEEHRTAGGNQGSQKQLASSASSDKGRKAAPAASKKVDKNSKNQEEDDDWETF